MRALARASDEIAPSDTFENNMGTMSNAKRVPTRLATFWLVVVLAQRQRVSDIFRKAEIQKRTRGVGPKGIFQAGTAGKLSRRWGPTHGSIPVG